MSDALFAFVVNAVWQAALIAGLGMLLARSVAAARQRFELLALTLIACVAAPALTFAPRSAPTSATAIVVAPRTTSLLTVIYVVGLAIVAIRFAIAFLRARRIVATSTPFRGRIRLSTRIDGPVTIGRTVLLPSRIAGDRRLVAAAVSHEHAHVRRNDYLVHVALELIALPLYFHPALVLLRRAIADAREMACDEEAAARRGRRKYAEALVQLAAVAARPAMEVGMSSTSIERRVGLLLGATTGEGACPPTGKRRAMLILPLLAAVACTRFNAAPAAASMGGQWVLIKEASQFEGMRPPRYDAFRQTIQQEPSRITVRQERTAGGRTRVVSWNVITDGVTRPVGGVPNARGKGTWRDGKLQLEMTGPGSHHETTTVFVHNGHLVCDGRSERARYHVEFRRVKP